MDATLKPTWTLEPPSKPCQYTILYYLDLIAFERLLLMDSQDFFGLGRRVGDDVSPAHPVQPTSERHTSQSLSKMEGHSQNLWEAMRPTICRLYLEDSLARSEVMVLMHLIYGFRARSGTISRVDEMRSILNRSQ